MLFTFWKTKKNVGSLKLSRFSRNYPVSRDEEAHWKRAYISSLIFFFSQQMYSTLKSKLCIYLYRKGDMEKKKKIFFFILDQIVL